MKMSIRTKLFIIMFSILLIFFCIVILLNNTLLSNFYIHKKEKTLRMSCKELEKVYLINNEETLMEELMYIQEDYNVKVIIADNNFKCLYNSIFPTKTPDNQEELDIIIARHLKENEKNFNEGIFIKERKDEMLDATVMSLYSTFGSAENKKYVLINTSYSAIYESVQIYNRFCMLSGIIITFAGGIIVFFISKRVTKPIMEINKMTQNMVSLNFHDKLKINSNDELGLLGSNINTLSNTLETTLRQLLDVNAKLEKDIKLKEQVDLMRREFISSVSHELKTPISLILGYTEALMVKDTETPSDYYCDIIIDESNKMNKLVNSILKLSQLESGLVPAEKTTFKISDLIDRYLKNYQIKFENEKIELDTCYKGDFFVDADYELIGQVVNNYLSNAINHVQNAKTIKVSIMRNKGKIRVEVFNTGNNIKKEDLDRIWDSFYKVDKARTRAYGGHGLGLSIVKEIMKAHDTDYGVINVDDGVIFFFELDEANLS